MGSSGRLARANRMGVHTRFASLRHGVALFTLGFAWACSTAGVERANKLAEVVPCNTIPAVNDYYATVFDRVAEEFWNRLTPPARERARVVIRVTTRGSLIEAKVRRASSPEIEALLIDSVQVAAPFPPPPSAHWDCLVNAKLVLDLDIVKELDCEDDEVDEYVSKITDLITDEVFRMESREGHGWVRLNLDLNQDGSVTGLSTKGGSSLAARQRVERAVEQVQPLPAPPAAYWHCFAGTVFLSIIVPGS